MEKVIEYPNGLEIIKENTDVLLALPWNGHYGVFKVHMLNYTQLKACGDFSTLNIILDENDETPQLDAIYEIRNMQERMLKLALVSPSYDEIMEELNVLESVKKANDEIALAREALKTVLDVEEAKVIEQRLEMYDLYLGFLFPDDFIEAFTSILMQRDCTDITRVTEDMVLEAAMLAERGNDNPSDHLDGTFTSLQKEDINKYGWLLLNRYREHSKMDKDINKQWIRGRKRK